MDDCDYSLVNLKLACSKDVCLLGENRKITPLSNVGAA